MATDGGPRRGWREKVEPGVYRSHRLSCPSSHDEKPGRRCRCSWQVVVPGDRPGTTRMVKVEGAITEARAVRRSLLAAGRPKVAPTVEPNTLDEFAAAYFAAKAPVPPRTRSATATRTTAPGSPRGSGVCFSPTSPASESRSGWPDSSSGRPVAAWSFRRWPRCG